MNENKLKCVVVDDEKHARDLLKHYIANDERLIHLSSFPTVSELVSSKEINQIDILFLDVEMPGKSGIDFLKETNNPFKVILTTAYKDYAIEGFDLNVFDYLLKPIFEERFKQCINKVFDLVTIEKKAKKYDSVKAFENKYLVLKSGYSELKIWLKDIIYISSENEYVSFHTLDKKHLIYVRLKEIEAMLPSSIFIRTHRSFIVSKAFVTKIEKDKIVLNNSVNIPVSRSNKIKLEQLFHK